MKKAFLILADGTVFEGQSIGAEGITIGETVFTTGMTGYIETLTDPSYFGQIVTQTFPLIGNYGVIPEDYESSKSWVRGYIVRELCDSPSNFRCEFKLNKFLKEQSIVGISGIDTRALTKKLRESGVMNGMICSGESRPQINDTLLTQIKNYKITQAVESVSCTNYAKQNAEYGINNNTGFRIVLWDFGAKTNIQRELEKRGCKVTLLPAKTTAEEILNINPDGIMLSNGPGDPAENINIINELKKICEWNKTQACQKSKKQIAVFGICLGHQLLALARGCSTLKLKYGHRGGNHPVNDLETDRVYITSQNHGYAVDSKSIPDFAREKFININDGNCEGITYTDIPAFSVQFHPEACGGPHDTNYLFDKFIELMENCNASK